MNQIRENLQVLGETGSDIRTAKQDRRLGVMYLEYFMTESNLARSDEVELMI